jgi:hypothetical protein
MKRNWKRKYRNGNIFPIFCSAAPRVCQALNQAKRLDGRMLIGPEIAQNPRWENGRFWLDSPLA